MIFFQFFIFPSIISHFPHFFSHSQHSFDSVSDLLEPVSDGRTDGCFISRSYDAASHFEACAEDVLSMYRRITGTELDMSISAEMTEDDM